MSCFFKHRWGRWHLYEETSLSKAVWESTFSKTTEVRQARQCKDCGTTEDEFVKTGPLPKVSWATKEERSSSAS